MAAPALGPGDPVREFNNGIFFYREKATLFAEDSKIILFNAEKEGKREEYSIPTKGMQEAMMTVVFN